MTGADLRCAARLRGACPAPASERAGMHAMVLTLALAHVSMSMLRLR